MSKQTTDKRKITITTKLPPTTVDYIDMLGDQLGYKRSETVRHIIQNHMQKNENNG